MIHFICAFSKIHRYESRIIGYATNEYLRAISEVQLEHEVRDTECQIQQEVHPQLMRDVKKIVDVAQRAPQSAKYYALRPTQVSRGREQGWEGQARRNSRQQRKSI